MGDFVFPPYAERFIMFPVMKGQPLRDVLEYWSLADLLLFYINYRWEIRRDAFYYKQKQIMEKQNNQHFR